MLASLASDPSTSQALAFVSVLHEKCDLTSLHLFISQAFIEHLVISANLTLCVTIILSYATGWRGAAVSDLT